MKTFYQGLTTDVEVKGWVILTNKKGRKSLIYTKEYGLIVIPRCVYLYTWYVPRNFWDALKRLFDKEQIH